jgi:protein-S-isoprenylcysteine O-methyltransferase Ste14
MKEKRGEHPFGDAGQLICVAVFLFVWVGDSFFFHWTTFLANYVPNLLRNTLLGIALLIAFVLLRSGVVVIASKERPDHVVDKRAFQYVRHPIYLAVLIVYIGTVISSISLLSFALLVPIFFFYNYIAGYEEKLLETKFGESYREYERKTGKWLPGVGRRS